MTRLILAISLAAQCACSAPSHVHMRQRAPQLTSEAKVMLGKLGRYPLADGDVLGNDVVTSARIRGRVWTDVIKEQPRGARD